MVTSNVKKIITSCLTIIGHLFDTIIVAAADKDLFSIVNPFKSG